MQGGLSSTDRKLLWGAGAVAFVMAAATVSFAPAGHGNESKVPSTYSSASAGARAAYLLLQDLQYPVRRWEDPPGRLAAMSHGGVLILAEPTQMPSVGESASLLKFVGNGGRILFCGPAILSFFPAAAVSEPSAGEQWRKVSADLPAPFTRGARNITIEPKALWKRLSSRQLALYGGESAAVVVLWRIGKGELLWWAAATPLTNAGITETDNLTLFLNAVIPPGAEPPLNIYWDEYFHGSRNSLWSYVETTPVKWALVQLTLIALAVLFTFSRRWGPIAIPRSASRLSPLEFVDTLGGLYQRAGATSIATGVAYRHLRLSLTRGLGLGSATPDATLAHAAGARLGWDSGDLTTTLEKAAMAQTHNLRGREALDLVQKIARYTARLTNKRAPREKN